MEDVAECTDEKTRNTNYTLKIRGGSKEVPHPKIADTNTDSEQPSFGGR